ncbi:MAG: aldo/keto reductase [Clostridiaceae bacterium]|nr:aldo/keto reductase [Clostridiaceae bacterium]MDD6274374.1 aldo/keto reductase [Clostridiaceae bacterium]
MRYKHFRNANVDVSAMAVGTWPIGDCGYGTVTEKDSIEAIHAMFDNGVNMLDTAPDYGVGHSETVVGKAIKGYDRSKIFLATKCCASALTLKSARTGRGYCRDGRYEDVLYECEQSLRRLGTDYIDFYFVHWPDVDTPFSETMEAMKTLKQQGKIRFVGLSNFNKQQVLECEKVVKVDVLQPPFSMVVRSSEDLMKWAVQRGIDTCTYGSLGGGILTGAFRTAPDFERRDPRNFFYPFFREPSFGKVMKVVDVLDQIAAEVGKPVSQVAVNWQTQQPHVSTALCGVRTAAEAVENCGAFEWELTDAQIQAINAAIAANLDFDGADRSR